MQCCGVVGINVILSPSPSHAVITIINCPVIINCTARDLNSFSFSDHSRMSDFIKGKAKYLTD